MRAAGISWKMAKYYKKYNGRAVPDRMEEYG